MRKNKIELRSIAITIIIFFSTIFSANAGTKTWTGNVSTDWSISTNWSGGLPGSGDDAVIQGSLSRYPNIINSQSFIVKTIAVNSGAALTISGGTLATNDNKITVDGGTINQSGGIVTAKDMELKNGGTYNQSGGEFQISHDLKVSIGNIFASTGGTVRFTGIPGPAADYTGSPQFYNLIVDAGADYKFDNISDTIKIAGNYTNNNNSLNNTNGTLIFNGSGIQYIYSMANAGNAIAQNIIVDKSAESLILNSILLEISGDVTAKNGTLDINSCSFQRTSAGGSLTLSNSSTLKIGGTNGIPTSFASRAFSKTSTVNYSGSDQNVNIESYGNLILSGIGTKTFVAGTTKIAGNLILVSPATVNAYSNNTIIEYNGSGSQTIQSMQYYTLLISSTGLKTFSSGVTLIQNEFNITGNATFDACTNNTIISYGGINNQFIQPIDYYQLTLTNSGIKYFSSDTTRIASLLVVNSSAIADALINHSTIEFNGSGSQTIKPIDYYNLVLSGAGTKYFSAGTTGISGSFSIIGNATVNTIANTSKIDFNGSTDQTVLGIDYYNLTLSNSGTKFLGSGTVGIGGDLDLKDLAVIDAETYNDTIKYYLTDKNVRYGFINKNAKIEGKITVTVLNDFTVSGSLIISQDATLDMNGHVLLVGEKLLNNGTYISTNPAGSMSFYSKNSGDFNSLDSWSNSNYSSSSAVRLPGTVNNDVLIIGNNKTINLTSNISNLGTIRVDSSGTLNPADYTVSGHGEFDLRGYGALKITSSNGVNSSSGNIQTAIQLYNSSAIYEFSGLVPQITGDDFPFSVKRLVINNPNGVTLSNNTMITDGLSLTQGNLILRDKDLTIGTASTIDGTPSSSNMIVADGSGQLRKEFSSVGSFTFPVGDTIGAAEYSPVTLNFTSGTFANAYAGVKVVNEKHPLNNSSKNYINRYWSINSNGISDFSCIVKCNYTDEDIFPGSEESKIFTGKYYGTKWTLLNPANGSLNELSGTVSSFSDFTGGESDALPVELISFKALVENNSVQLNWFTATELNNHGFEVERSSDNNTFTRLGFIRGQGNSSSIQQYSFDDENLSNGTYYYRLKQLDNDGSFTHSNTINVTIDLKPPSFELSQNYPNPFNPTTKIRWQSPVSGWQTLKVYDVLGNEVTTLVNEYRDAGYYEISFGNSSKSQLASGVYYYQIRIGDFSETKKMILSK